MLIKCPSKVVVPVLQGSKQSFLLKRKGERLFGVRGRNGIITLLIFLKNVFVVCFLFKRNVTSYKNIPLNCGLLILKSARINASFTIFPSHLFTVSGR